MPLLRSLIHGELHALPLEGEVVTFGRSPECHLVLEGDGISRHHGRFVRSPDGNWWVEDQGSKNGVLVQGVCVSRHRLNDGDVIAVGSRVLTFCTDPTTSLGVHEVTLGTGASEPSITMERSPRAPHSVDHRRLLSLCEIGRCLLDQSGIEGLVETAARAMLTEFQAEKVVFGLTTDPAGEPDKLIVRPPQRIRGEIRLSLSILRRCMEARSAILVADTGSDELLQTAHSIVSAGIRSAMCVPMLRGEQVTGFIYIDSRRGAARRYEASDLDFAGAIGAMLGTAVENARLRDLEVAKQRLDAELAAARKVQDAILPSRWPACEGWDIAGHHMISREVGGDYYDAILTPGGRLWLIMADACGKGAPAALLATKVHAAFHALADVCSAPSELLGKLNELLLRREVRSSFVTCLLAMIDPATGRALLASAGHPHPLVRIPRQPPAVIPITPGYMLGILPDVGYEDACWEFSSPDALLLMYTDGISEAMNAAGDQYGDDRLLHALGQLPPHSAAEVVEGLLRHADEFCGPAPRFDDLTLLICRRSP